MINKVYKCSWCKKILSGHPICFDLRKYTGSYRGYQTSCHFYFCTECYKKIVKFIIDNQIKSEKVQKNRS